MINDTYTVRLSGNGWAAALQKNYSGVFLAARQFIAAAVDVPVWQVTIHTLRSGSLVIFFSLNQFQPRYKNITEVESLLLAGNAADAQSTLNSILNTTATPESVEPLGVVYQNGQPLVMPVTCDATCVALIVSCVVGSTGVIAIALFVFVKLKLYFPIDYDFEAEAAKKEEERRLAAEAETKAAENRASHVHEADDEDGWDERRRSLKESTRGGSGVQRDVIHVTSIDPKHYHLEASMNNQSSNQTDDGSVFSPSKYLATSDVSQHSHSYLIWGQETDADRTPQHAVTDGNDERDIELKPREGSPPATNSAGLPDQGRHSSQGPSGMRASSYRGKGDSPIMVDRSASNTPQQSAQSSPRKKTTFAVVNPRMPDPAVVSRIQRPSNMSDASSMSKSSSAGFVSSRTSHATLSVAVGSLPTSPAPPSVIEASPPPLAAAVDHRSDMPRTAATTTHTVARWSVQMEGASQSANPPPLLNSAHRPTIDSPQRPTQPQHASHQRHDPFRDIPVVDETDITTPQSSARPTPRPPVNKSARPVTYVEEAPPPRFADEDVAFVDIVEVGSAMDDDDDEDYRE
jgi:hypothetical protein